MPSDEMRAVIASRLKTAREQAGLTQAEVARVLGLHRPAISEIEAGRRSVAAEELALLASIYGISISWLLDCREPDQDRDRLELAAQALSKLRQEDVARLLAALRGFNVQEGKGPKAASPGPGSSPAGR